MHQHGGLLHVPESIVGLLCARTRSSSRNGVGGAYSSVKCAHGGHAIGGVRVCVGSLVHVTIVADQHHIFHFVLAAGKTVKLALAEQNIFVSLLQLYKTQMHFVDSALEGFEVVGYADEVAVQSANLEFMVLEVCVNLGRICLFSERFAETFHVEFFSDIDDPQVKTLEC